MESANTLCAHAHRPHAGGGYPVLAAMTASPAASGRAAAGRCTAERRLDMRLRI